MVKKTDEKAEELLTANEAADYLKVHRATLHRYINAGVIPSKFIHHLGGGLRFFKSELNLLIKTNMRPNAVQLQEGKEHN